METKHVPVLHEGRRDDLAGPSGDDVGIDRALQVPESDPHVRSGGQNDVHVRVVDAVQRRDALTLRRLVGQRLGISEIIF